MNNKKTNNSRQAFWVALGSFFSFSFAIISSMILSRYFDKNEYGTYKQVLYVYNTLLIVFTLGVPKAFSFFLPRVGLVEGKSLINKIILLLFFLGIIFSACLFFLAEYLAGVLNNIQLTEPLKYFSLVPIFMLPIMGLDGILATYKRTLLLAIYNITTKVLMLLFVALPVVFFDGNCVDAIKGFTLSSFISMLIAFYLMNTPFHNIKSEKCEITYSEIFHFTLPLLYASFFGLLIQSADQFFISRYFGSSVFAEFSNGSMELPFVGMVISACSTVLIPLFSKNIHEKSNPSITIFPVWNSVFCKTVKLIYPLVLFSFVYSDEIMIFLYGNQYLISGNYFKIKLIVNLFTLISYYPLIIAINANSFYAKVHILHAIILISLDYISASLLASSYAVAFSSVLCRIINISVLLYYLSRYFGIKLTDMIPFSLIAKILIPSLIILYSIKIISKIYITDNLLLLIIGMLLYFIVYFIWSFISKIDYISILRPIIKIK